MVARGLEGWRDCEGIFNGHISCVRRKRVMEMDGDDVCIINVFNTTELYS